MPAATDEAMAMMRLRAGPMLAAMAIAGLALLSAAPAIAEQALLLEVDGVIAPPIADYLVREIGTAKPDQTRLIILRMNTPGGLDTSMRQIIRAILASPVPVATYVAPNGARAASAGTYIAYASAIAAMAPGTNIGAATPVQFGGNPLLPSDQKEKKEQKQSESKSDEPADAETRKIVNDAVAYIRSLAALNGRNAEWAVEAVRSAASLPAAEALSLHVIDTIADDVPDLLRKIDGRTVAFILLLIGVYGVIFEFLNPGAVAPGLIGAISLLVALYALAFVPINYAGAALVLLGVALMVAEVHIGAFGALAVGGIAAFVIGSLMMFPAHAPGLTLSIGVVVGAAIGSAALLLLALAALLRSRNRPVVTGSEALVGAEGEIVSWQGGDGRVRVMGEIWLARANASLAVGSRVKIIGRDGLVLHVEDTRLG
jgi:membrane-bound serine protease (ClpP class)